MERKIFFLSILSFFLQISVLGNVYDNFPRKLSNEIYKDDPAKQSDIDGHYQYIENEDYIQIDLDDNWWENPVVEGEGEGGFVGEQVALKDSIVVFILLLCFYIIYIKKNRNYYE